MGMLGAERGGVRGQGSKGECGAFRSMVSGAKSSQAKTPTAFGVTTILMLKWYRTDMPWVNFSAAPHAFPTQPLRAPCVIHLLACCWTPILLLHLLPGLMIQQRSSQQTGTTAAWYVLALYNSALVWYRVPHQAPVPALLPLLTCM